MDDRKKMTDDTPVAGSEENSNEEMAILKEAFAKPAASSGADLFATDLFAPAPEPQAKSAEPAAEEKNVKVVTDDDIHDLFDMSSPGLSPETAKARTKAERKVEAGESVAEISAPQPAPKPTPAKSEKPEPKTEPSGPMAAEVEEIGLFEEKPASASPEPSSKSAPPEKTANAAANS